MVEIGPNLTSSQTVVVLFFLRNFKNSRMWGNVTIDPPFNRGLMCVVQKCVVSPSTGPPGVGRFQLHSQSEGACMRPALLTTVD